MSTAPTVLLEAQALRCERNGRPLFPAVDLRLHPHEAIWLRGANGCGKTTLVRTLAGLHRPAGGQVRHAAPLRYVGHGSGLKDLLTVEESAQLAAELDHAPLHGVQPALARLGLMGLRKRRCGQLSQGQRRRTALATLALPQPPGCVWLLDEPFDALDDEGLRCLAALIAEHCRAGGALLFTSHQPVGGLLQGLPVQERRLS